MNKHQNKIEKLIEELCPNGVGKVALGELTTEQTKRNSVQSIHEVRSVTNSVGLVKTSDFFDNTRTSQDTSNYKIVEPGMVVYNPSRINVGSIARHKESVSVIVSPMYIVVSIDTKKICPEYLDIFLSSTKGKSQILNNVEVGARFRFTYESFAKMKLFLPPLPIQNEIVKILDSFTELEAELEAELEVRKKQYEHCREELLTFGDGVEWKSLGEVSNIYDGTHQTPKYTTEGVKFVSVENIKSIYQSNKYVSKEDYDKLYKIKPKLNDVFMTRIGSIGVCAVIDKEKEDLAYYVTLTLIRPNQNKLLSKYLKYIIESSIGRKELYKRTLVNATPIKINLGEIGKIKIPVPSLVEQERIVKILDRFDGLVNDISIGLPAEIKARRQQYEYYRNKLLTFKEYVK